MGFFVRIAEDPINVYLSHNPREILIYRLLRYACLLLLCFSKDSVYRDLPYHEYGLPAGHY